MRAFSKLLRCSSPETVVGAGPWARIWPTAHIIIRKKTTTFVAPAIEKLPAVIIGLLRFKLLEKTPTTLKDRFDLGQTVYGYSVVKSIELAILGFSSRDLSVGLIQPSWLIA
jgi:hypothetical protein